MSRFVPTASEERDAAIGLPTRWRSHKAWVAILFFVFTTIGVAALYFLFDEHDLAKGPLVLVVSIGTAELLIVALRWFGTGVESALWISGLFAAICALPGPPRTEALLLFAAAAALAGARLRNPWLGGIAAVFAIEYADDKAVAAVATAVVISIVALLMLLRVWRRPSTERLWCVLLIVCPVAAALFTDEAPERHHAIVPWTLLGALALFVGIRKRHRAVLAAGAIDLALAAVAARDLIPLPDEAKLAMAGVLLLATSVLLSRALRGRTQGMVTTPLGAWNLEPMQALSALAVVSHGRAEENPQPAEGGRYGGAGATGGF